MQSAVQRGGNVTFHSNIFISVLGIKDSEVCFGFSFLFLLSFRKREEEIARMSLIVNLTLEYQGVLNKLDKEVFGE